MSLIFRRLSATSILPTTLGQRSPVSGKANDSEPKFIAEFNTLVADTPIDQIRIYLRWHLLHAYAGTSMPEAFVSYTWYFY